MKNAKKIETEKNQFKHFQSSSTPYKRRIKLSRDSDFMLGI